MGARVATAAARIRRLKPVLRVVVHLMLLLRVVTVVAAVMVLVVLVLVVAVKIPLVVSRLLKSILRVTHRTTTTTSSSSSAEIIVEGRIVVLPPVEAVLVHWPFVEPAPPVVKSPMRRRRVLPMEAMLCVLVVESRRRHS